MSEEELLKMTLKASEIETVTNPKQAKMSEEEQLAEAHLTLPQLPMFRVKLTYSLTCQALRVSVETPQSPVSKQAEEDELEKALRASLDDQGRSRCGPERGVELAADHKPESESST